MKVLLPCRCGCAVLNGAEKEEKIKMMLHDTFLFKKFNERIRMYAKKKDELRAEDKKINDEIGKNSESSDGPMRQLKKARTI